MKILDRSEQMFDMGIARSQAVKLHKPYQVLHGSWGDVQIKVHAEIGPITNARDDVSSRSFHKAVRLGGAILVR